MADLTGKYAVVTGAGKGIGRASAARLLQDGAAGVALLDWDAELAEAAAREIDPTGTRAVAIRCDVADEENVHAAFAEVFGRFGRVDILVNNAGITRDAMFHKMTGEQIKKVMDVHFYGTYYCTREVVPGMRERCGGKIINISSTSAFGNPGQSNYSAAKAAIDGFTRTLAKELGRKNITVNSIAPGFIDTDIIKTVPPDMLKASIAGTPMQRLGSPSEVASVVSFLAGGDSSFVSGCCILCCGGATTRG